MFPLNLERGRAWLGCGIALGSLSDFHSYHPNRGRGCDFRRPRVLFSLIRVPKNMRGVYHPWWRNIKYWEENFIFHSFVDS